MSKETRIIKIGMFWIPQIKRFNGDWEGVSHDLDTWCAPHTQMKYCRYFLKRNARIALDAYNTLNGEVK